jgi:hypothetical protein
MDPKSGKPRPLLVNPFAIWTEFALRSGQAMLESTQAVLIGAQTPKVAVVPSADVQTPKVAVVPSVDAPSAKPLPAKARRRKVASKPQRKKRRAKR